MKEFFNNFLLFVQFLTRIPINKNLPCEMDNFKNGIIFFPVIGLIIGGVQWIVVYVFSRILPVNIVAVFAIIAALLITGALHVDGWGDVFDGFFSFKGGKEKIIEVMKDSRIGTYSCIAIICNFILKYAGISNLITGGFSLWIIAVPVMAKCCVVFICYIGNTAKKTGSGNVFIGNVELIGVIVSSLIGMIIIVPIVGAGNFLIIAIVDILLTLLINIFCKHYIGGHTGDTLGFTSEAIEIVTLIVMSSIVFNM
ncbi:adenosylcobinamide-GDP ribazoletransferase [Clostridium sp. KNHs214]|uniref:adenosylcobinamide-GDP ribazoletransferase n=1 Tax=Clostridium sp. KNHs214 TaxID=1540257 RepID=UPI000550A72B|nr:adenosylcobinamide-GDP ribazoletransferase [Clostridium sp. KNHs214]